MPCLRASQAIRIPCLRIAITGATGFIGRYLVHGMAREGHDVRVLCRPGREEAVDHPDGKPCEIHVGDLTDGRASTAFSRTAI